MKENNHELASSRKNIRQVNHSRRSFAKVSIGLAPVMMTLTNRSAWGRDVNICTQSGFHSATLFGSQGVVETTEPVDYTPPPGGGNSGSINAWETWANTNGLTGEPFDTWIANGDVDSWKAFAHNCVLSLQP